jgi:hypothetical protein
MTLTSVLSVLSVLLVLAGQMLLPNRRSHSNKQKLVTAVTMFCDSRHIVSHHNPSIVSLR